MTADNVAILADLRSSRDRGIPSLLFGVSSSRVGSSCRQPHVSHVSLLASLSSSSPGVQYPLGDLSDGAAELLGVGNDVVDKDRLIGDDEWSSPLSEAGGEMIPGIGNCGIEHCFGNKENLGSRTCFGEIMGECVVDLERVMLCLFNFALLDRTIIGDGRSSRDSDTLKFSSWRVPEFELESCGFS